MLNKNDSSVTRGRWENRKKESEAVSCFPAETQLAVVDDEQEMVK